MQLLQHEINVEPGEVPKQDIRKGGAVGLGRGVLRIENTAKIVNAYTVTFSCEDPGWNKDWCKLDALDPPKGEQVGATGYLPDEIGLHCEYVKVHVLSGASRDIAIDIEVPRSPLSRAGIYRLKIVIDCTTQGGSYREDQREVKDAIVIVRPYYEWSLQTTPKERKVGVFKRRDRYEVQIENLGNDWLYCDLAPKDQEALEMEFESQRIAVPPSFGSGHSTRLIPLKVFHPKRIWRGSKQASTYAIEVIASRIDAPCIAPLTERAWKGEADANYTAAVIARDTTEHPRIVNIPKLIFGPLIPATLTDFTRALMANARSILFLMIGAILAYHMLAFTWARLAQNAFSVNALSDTWPKGQRLTLKGTYIGLTIVKITDPADPSFNPPPEKVVPFKNGIADEGTIAEPPELRKHHSVKLEAFLVPTGLFDMMLKLMPSKDASVSAAKPVILIEGGPASSDAFVEAPANPPLGQKAVFTLHGVTNDQLPLTVEVLDDSGHSVQKFEVNSTESFEATVVEHMTLNVYPKGASTALAVKDAHGVNTQQSPDIPLSGTGSGVTGGQTGASSASGGAEGTAGSGGVDQGGSGSTGGGATAQLPSQYPSLLQAMQVELTDHLTARRLYGSVADSLSSATDGVSLALRSFALAASGKHDDAQAALTQATNANAPQSLLQAAKARLDSTSDSRIANSEFSDAVGSAAKDHYNFAYLAAAEYQVIVNRPDNARLFLQGIPNDALSADERATVVALPH